jgi:outer membrane protein TolC
LRGSDFGARRGYANAIRATKDAERKAQLLDLSHDAARAYVDLWAAQANMDLLDGVIRDAKRQSKTVTAAAAQGIADKSEADIFTTEAAEMELKKTALAAQRQTFLTAFVRLAGLPMADYRLDKPASAHLPDNAAAVLSQADSETSVRSILSGRQSVAERRLAVARVDASFPMISPRAVVGHDSDNNSTSLMLGIHYALPVWSQNQAEILRAQADVGSTESALRALDKNDFPTVLRTAWQAARDNEAVAAKYESSIVPSWRKIQTLTEKKLGMGQASVFDLWQVRNRLLETQTQALAAQRTALESVLTLENLSGTSFNATPAKGN